MNTVIYIHGKGGHGGVVADAARQSDMLVRTTDDAEGTRPPENSRFIVAIGDNAVRKSLGGNTNIVHPSAIVSVPVKCGVGNYIGAGVVINPGVRIGNGSIINTGVIIEHDCSIGDYAHIAPGAMLCGGVQIGEGALVGAGSVVKFGCVISEWVVIGCGSVIINDIPRGETWAGNPARRIRGDEGTAGAGPGVS